MLVAQQADTYGCLFHLIRPFCHVGDSICIPSIMNIHTRALNHAVILTLINTLNLSDRSEGCMRSYFLDMLSGL